MESAQIANIIKEVKIILNENISIDALLLDDPNQLELEDLISSRIVDAVTAVHENAPIEKLTGVPLTGGIAFRSNGVGTMPLPNDFLRLVIFQLEGWSRPVTMAITDTSPLYAQQMSRFIGVRGGVEKPVCAISTIGSTRVLEIFSAAPSTTPDIARASYIPIPAIDAGTIKIAKRLKTAIYYYCAGLVAVSLKDPSATALFDISKYHIA